MPAPRTSRQPASRAEAALAREPMRNALRRCLHAAAADVARRSGRYGLIVQPHADDGYEIATPNLHTRVQLERDGDRFDGDLRCEEAALPLADGSCALVFAACAFETARDPVGLAAECARILEPEGALLVLGLNPLSPLRLRWMFGGLRAWSPDAVRVLLTGLGLEIVGCRYLGGHWPTRASQAFDLGDVRRRGSPFRSGFLLEARRRDPGMTPLRAKSAKLRIGAGANAGSARMRVKR